MPDSNDNTNWRENLTAAQQETVLRTIAATYNASWQKYGDRPGWDNLPPEVKDAHARCQLVGLRAAGVIPPAKAKMRGEVVASRMVPEPVQGSNEVFILHAANERPPLLLFQGQGFSGSADLVRKYIAEAVDGECNAVLEKAASDVAVITGDDSLLPRTLRALKSNPREHLRDDVAKPHEPAAPCS
jgi:hypothetical protein